MPALLLVNAAATMFMTGLIWLVQLVHYPLFGRVGEGEFEEFHAEHSRRITPLVLPVMTIELVSSFLLVVDRPDEVSAMVVWVGAALAAGLWASTILVQAPAHQRLEARREHDELRHLMTGNWLRTVAWTARSGLVLAMLAVAG